jgi:hypothetical protein
MLNEPSGRKRTKCKIDGCTVRGRYNYGVEYFYYGFCKDHYSLYQEGIIDINGNVLRPKYTGVRDITDKSPSRKKYIRWRKTDHVKNNLRCKVSRCEKDGELDRGRRRFPKGFCSHHYREWYLKGFMDIDGKVIRGVRNLDGDDDKVTDMQIVRMAVKKLKNKKYH